MTKASDNLFPKLFMEEVANDGSATTTPAADHRAAFIGEDGLWHVKDSSAVVTSPQLTYAQVSRVVVNGGDLSTSSTSFVDATGLTTTITTGAHRVEVHFTCGAFNDGGGANATCFDIAIDGTRVGSTRGLQEALTFGTISLYWLSDVLTAASHTIKIQWKVTGNNGTIFATTTRTPAVLTVNETFQTA